MRRYNGEIWRHNRLGMLKLGIAAVTLLPIFVGSATVHAQDTAEKAFEMDEVVVTGSRIRSGNVSSPSPMNVLDEDSFKQTGSLTVSEAINQLPQLGESFGAQNQDINSLNGGFNAGTELINLRNMGSQRTLVLVNGRRHIGGDPGTSSVDLNTIPSEMIDRVEVITGAASAVYGADAVTGVVNIILKKKYKGASVSARMGAAGEGNGEEYKLGALFGDTFSDDRGSALFSVEYTKQQGIRGSNRSFAQYDGNKFTSNPINGSSAVPGGRIFATNGQFTFDANNSLIPFGTTRFQRLPQRDIQTPVERILISTSVNYEVLAGDDFTANFFTEATYANTKASITFEPQLYLLNGGRFGKATERGFDGPKMPANNPFLLALAPTLGAINPAGVSVFRRLTEYGPRVSKIDRDTFRIVLGFDGEIGENLSYEIYYQHGEVKATQEDFRTINKDRFFAGLDVNDNGTPADFSDDTCASSFYAALGCTPVNIFGQNTITQDFIDYSLIDVLSKSRSKQDVISGYITGKAFELPAGDVGFVLGGEYRKESMRVTPDEALQDGSASTRQIAPLSGSFDVKEVFGELKVPVLSDSDIVDHFDITGAARYSDYSTVGGKFSWSVTTDIAFNNIFRLRGSYGTAVRAPNMEESFAPVTSSTTTVQDPCDTLNDDTSARSLSATAATNCSAELGGLAAGLDQVAIQRQTVGTQSSGNAGLGAEEAKTFTAGLVIQPDGVIGGLTLSADYYSIKINNVITGLNVQDIVNQCYDRPGLPSVFCDQITRDGTTGQLLSVNNVVLNAASEKLTGLDVQLNYALDVANDGQFVFNVNWTHLFKHEITPPIAGANVDVRTGQVGDFRNRANLFVGYSMGAWGINWTTRFLGSAKADTSIVDGTFTDGQGKDLNDIGAVWYHDLQASYRFDKEGLILTAGIKNLFDKNPPLITSPARTAVSAGTTVGGIYDTRGRFFYLSGRVNF